MCVCVCVIGALVHNRRGNMFFSLKPLVLGPRTVLVLFSDLCRVSVAVS